MAGMTLSVNIAHLEPFREFIQAVKKVMDNPEVPQSIKNEIDAAIIKLAVSEGLG